MWYLYLTIGLAAVCIGIPLFLIYWTDKRSKRSFEKKNKKSKSLYKKKVENTFQNTFF